ncbi:uncharacterized protein LOC142327428 [Lycorma delicatula]|uniref:uncharacterized protein LOC142327428 n=1 Tax=Lycorma delicatula TaxID=130591 RepID=UPI003F5128FE
MWFSSVINMYKIIVFTIIIHVARSLRVTDISVPRYAELGSTIIMKCNFTLGSGKLNSVKWYKDELEFFRYLPDVNLPNTNIQIFPQNGIALDMSKSDKNHVALTDLTYNSSGLYKCEVSSDAPDFKTDTRNGSLTVNAYLRYEPVISGVADRYSPGETITANCTAGPSNPAPRISWFINDEEVGLKNLRQYHTIENGDNLYSRSLGLQFQVGEGHFLPSTDYINIQCKATVADMSLETFMRPHRLQYTSAIESSLQRFRNNSTSITTTLFRGWVMILLTLITMVSPL